MLLAPARLPSLTSSLQQFRILGNQVKRESPTGDMDRVIPVFIESCGGFGCHVQLLLLIARVARHRLGDRGLQQANRHVHLLPKEPQYPLALLV